MLGSRRKRIADAIRSDKRQGNGGSIHCVIIFQREATVRPGQEVVYMKLYGTDVGGHCGMTLVMYPVRDGQAGDRFIRAGWSPCDIHELCETPYKGS